EVWGTHVGERAAAPSYPTDRVGCLELNAAHSSPLSSATDERMAMLRLSGLRRAGPDESGLVCPHDRLHPIAQLQLAEHAADMGFGGVALGDVGDVPEADPVIGSTFGFSAPAGYRFPVRGLRSGCAGTCVMACPIAMSRSCWPSEVSTWIT